METRNLIAGNWVDASDGARFDVLNPASDAVIASVPMCGAVEAFTALQSASAFQPQWEATDPTARAQVLRSVAALLRERKDSLAHIITSECGKPLTEALGEVLYSADYFSNAAEQLVAMNSVNIDLARADVYGVVRHRAAGVCAAITPWNFPLAMLARKIAPALAAGCTQLVKPAEETPLSAIALAEIVLECGLAPQCLHILTGDAKAIATTWLMDGRVRKLSFTGSTETGRLLLQQSAAQIVRCSLELGGQAAFIVLKDADMNEAVRAAVQAKFRNAGQTCICPNRFLVHESLANEFAARVAVEAASLKIAPGTEAGCQIGPLIHDAAVNKVRAHIADALSHGGKLVCGGRTMNLPNCCDRFFQPTVITNCHTQMLCFVEETFGPLLPIMSVKSAEEAIEIANSTPWGLAGYVFGGNNAATLALAHQLNCGVIGVNDAAPSNARAPFGGVKWSGYGREGGAWGVMEYVTTQYLAVKTPQK